MKLKLLALLLLVLPAVQAFEIQPSVLYLSIEPADTAIQNITILNDEKPHNFIIGLNGLEQIALFNQSSFLLGANEQRTLNLTFRPEFSGVYVGELTVNTEGESKSIPIVVEVETPERNFDCVLTITSKEGKIVSEGEIFYTVDLLNVNNAEPANVLLTHALIDLNGKVLAEKHESVAVGSNRKLTKSVKIPRVRSGNYVLSVMLEDKGRFSSSARVVKIKEKKDLLFWIALLMAGASSLLAIGYLTNHKFKRAVEKSTRRSAHLAILSSYISKMRKMGYTDVYIKFHLKRAGWPDHLVDVFLKR